jgi:hypothetical protein
MKDSTLCLENSHFDRLYGDVLLYGLVELYGLHRNVRQWNYVPL